MPHTYTVVVAHQDAGVNAFMCDVLADEGYQVFAYNNAELTVDMVERVQPHALLLDLHPFHPEATLLLLDQLRRRTETYHIPIIVTTTDHKLLERLFSQLQSFACEPLLLPCHLNELSDGVAAMVRKHPIRVKRVQQRDLAQV